MNRAHTFLRGSVFSGGAVVLSSLAMFVIWKMASNGLSQEAFALFLLFILAADLGNLVFGWGLAVTLPRLFAVRDATDRVALAGGVMRHLGSTGMVISVGIVLLAPVAGPWLVAADPSWAPAIDHACWFAPLFLIGLFRDVVLGILAGLNQYGLRAGAIVLSAIAYMALTALFLIGLDSGMGGLLQATILAYGVNVVIALYGLPQGWLRAGAWQDFGQAVRFSVPIHVNNILSFAYQRADSLLVTAFVGLEAVALYETAKRVPLLLARGVGALLVPYLPLISEMIAQDERAKARALFNHVLLLVITTTGLSVIVAAVLREDLIILLTNRDYLDAAPVMIALLVAMALTIQSGIAGQALLAIGRTIPITLANIGLIMVSFFGNLLILPRFGIMGAAWVAVVAILFSYGVQLMVVHRSGLPVQGRAWLLAQILFVAGLAAQYGAGDHFGYRISALVVYTLFTAWISMASWRAMRLALGTVRGGEASLKGR